MSRILQWTAMTSPQLWENWCARSPSTVQAEAAAIWTANRLAKDAAPSVKHRFYEVKDAWLQRVQTCLVEGRIARVERRYCRACNPLGLDPLHDDWHASTDDWCERCDGTGIWDERTLYVHSLDIEGTRYSFHSYMKPALLVDLPGEDKETYGGQFTETEWETLWLPLSGLLRMLRYVMMAVWTDNDRRIPDPMPPQLLTCHCRSWPGRKPGMHHDQCRKGGIYCLS